ncbi:choice-of-anchor C family protein [Streptomyces sp. 8K308]|uniref:choice-of-anchor C family protein n=1 Tax=Streptomyces sp. 8K308 TaxID=2530388 RepID=UPI0010477CBE|nr:choice-of-anchor C family protein [Streptomyces sp. 8K308]TDC22837.1 choice-of-anchor C family protein [Streptomyces sp. 8K308]
MAMRYLTAVVMASVLASAAGAVSQASAASVLAEPNFSNGGFEYPTIPNGYAQPLSAGQLIGPWVVGDSGVDLVRETYWEAAEGVQSIDLNANDPGRVSQTFATIPGLTYTVFYELAGNPTPGHPPAVKTGQILADGQLVADFTFDTTGKTNVDMGYVQRAASFVASDSTTELSFVSTTPGDAGPVIDDVRMSSCSC